MKMINKNRILVNKTQNRGVFCQKLIFFNRTLAFFLLLEEFLVLGIVEQCLHRAVGLCLGSLFSDRFRDVDSDRVLFDKELLDRQQGDMDMRAKPLCPESRLEVEVSLVQLRRLKSVARQSEECHLAKGSSDLAG